MLPYFIKYFLNNLRTPRLLHTQHGGGYYPAPGLETSPTAAADCYTSHTNAVRLGKYNNNFLSITLGLLVQINPWEKALWETC